MDQHINNGTITIKEDYMSKKYMIDLFAGAGGLSCGLELAGFTPVLANEIIGQYAQTYQVNHPDTKVIVGDIRQVDEKKLHSLVKEYGNIDLIAGGPPCQGFSVNAPIRSLNDPRNHLFKEYLRIVAEIKPKAVLIENVPGIISLGKGTVVEQIYKILENLGYKVKHRILFAGHYGVPQMRFRTVFIAIRDWNKEILFPTPQYYATGVANFQGSRKLCYELAPMDELILKSKTTVWDAISDLPELVGGEKTSTYEYTTKPMSSFQKYARKNSLKITSHFCSKLSSINLERLKYIPQGGSWRDIPYELLPLGLKKARRSDHTKRYGRLNPNELCSTIMTKCDPHWGSFFHPTQPRTLSVREAARIQSFPDLYNFMGNMTQQYEQIGNAVPPLLAKAVGETILQMIGDN